MKTYVKMMVLSTVLGMTYYGALAQQPVDATENLGFVVTASKYVENEKSVPLDTTVFTQSDLERTGATNIVEALRYLPGAMISGFGNHDQSWITGNSEVLLRGVQGGTLMLLNGVPVNFNGVSHLDMIPVQLVQRVEVVKGSGAIIYGSSAYGGVINVITKKQLDNSVYGKTGNHGRGIIGATIDAGDAGLVLQRDKSAGMLPSTKSSAGTRNYPDATGSLVKTPFHTAFKDSGKNSMAATYQFNDRLSALYLKTQKKYSTEYVKSSNFNELIQHFDYNDKEDFVTLNYADANWNGKAYYQKRSITNPDYYNVKNAVREWEHSIQEVYGADVSKKWGLAKSDVVVGLGYRYESYEDWNAKFAKFGFANSGLRPDAHFGKYSLHQYYGYGQWHEYINNKVETIVSARVEKFSSHNTDKLAVLPQAQVLYRINKDTSLYGNIGKSFRMPTFRNLYYSSGALLANPDLSPEYGWNYELGLKHITKDEETRLAIFHIALQDQIATRKVDGRNQAYNAAEYKTTGIEASYKKELSNGWHYRVGGILQNPERKDSATSPWKDVLGKYQVSASFGRKVNQWDYTINTTYYGNRVYYATQATKSPLWKTDVNVTYKPSKDVSFTLDVNNVFNRRDITNSDNGSIDYLVGERAIVLGSSYKF